MQFKLKAEWRGTITAIQVGTAYLPATCPDGLVEVPDELIGAAKAHPQLEEANLEAGSVVHGENE